MLQLVYVSSAKPGLGRMDVNAILATSRRNNARDGITGLLYFDGGRFLQVLEGPEDKVLAALERIGGDDRHRAVVPQSRRTIERAEFGDWSMAYRMANEQAGALTVAIDRLVAGASPTIRGTFEGFVRARAPAPARAESHA